MKPAITVRSSRFSFIFEKRTVIINLILFFLAVFACVIGPMLGHTLLSPYEVVTALFGNGSGANEFIVMQSRLPRTLLSLVAGAALGVSGMILQGIVRNPLAAPDIIGVTGGGAVAAVIFLTYGAGLSIQFLPLAAVTGSLLVAVLTYFLAWQRGITPIRLVLIGIGISAIMSAGTTFMIVVSSAVTASQAYLWLTGSVYGASWNDVGILVTVVFLTIPVTMVFSRSLNTQQLGNDTALGLGVRLQLDRLILLLFSVILAGSAVALVGAVGFVGLIAPHIARTLVGKTHGALTLASASSGALLLFGADLAARTLFYPVDIPAGVFTAGVGAPFFLYLLFRNRHHM
ncbi:FecCD family ABC transporter permease [Salipaludibacillus aurantiacus]|uniref:Iron complex transport system permease protein n=1 Tax=Salipaludibacillus aurantiacus TaxID=1601833 RepID=A0A1H9UAF0_9BACI|nr:iron ABC transporter permease [Salipaludibacillus aurantiacus]SES06134.1 iron complex transport system permease protein [Salipaludibacillus aurantiacus]